MSIYKGSLIIDTPYSFHNLLSYLSLFWSQIVLGFENMQRQKAQKNQSSHYINSL